MQSDGPPQFLFHGTKPEYVEEILDEGLQPREETGKSNWDHNEMPSISGHVYLSRLYAPYFGLAITGYEGEFAMVEIDVSRLDTEHLYPDEDFLVQAIDREMGVKVPPGLTIQGDMRDKTRTVRNNIAFFQPYWEVSVEFLGNCSHRGAIPPSAIRRASIVDPPDELRWNIDPTITIENAQFLGPRYEMYTRLLIGDDVSIEEYMSVQDIPSPDEAENLPDQFQEMHEQQRERGEMLTEQDYIEVRDNPQY